MKLRELLKFIEYNQKVIIRENRLKELFKGKARQVNLIDFGDSDVRYILADSDIYTRDYLKIEIKQQREVNE